MGCNLMWCCTGCHGTGTGALAPTTLLTSILHACSGGCKEHLLRGTAGMRAWLLAGVLAARPHATCVLVSCICFRCMVQALWLSERLVDVLPGQHLLHMYSFFVAAHVLHYHQGLPLLPSSCMFEFLFRCACMHTRHMPFYKAVVWDE